MTVKKSFEVGIWFSVRDYFPITYNFHVLCPVICIFFNDSKRFISEIQAFQTIFPVFVVDFQNEDTNII